MRGDWIRVALVQEPAGLVLSDVSVRGQAQVTQPDGMQLAGGGVEMDRAAGRLWMEGPGEVTLPLQRDLSGAALSQPRPVTIRWQQGMAFDGRTVECRGTVMARTGDQLLRADALKVTLDTDIDLRHLQQPSSDVQARYLEGTGNVQVESRSQGAAGLQAIDRMFVHDFSVDLVTGQCLAPAPAGSVMWDAGRRPGP